MRPEAIAVRLAHLSKTIECGMHSGIPVCCIKFYVTSWLWIDKYVKDPFFAEYWPKIEKRNPLYIPCPDCLLNDSIVETRACPDEICCNHEDEQAT